MSILTERGKKLKKENPEKYKLVCEAMRLSGGKVNNEYTFELIKSKAITAEDIVRLANISLFKDENGTTSIWEHTFWQENIYKNSESKIEKEAQKFRYKFKDTFLHRYMTANNFPELDENSLGAAQEFAVMDKYRKSGCYYYINSLKDLPFIKQMKMFRDFSENTKKAFKKYPILAENFIEATRYYTDSISSYYARSREISIRGDQLKKLQKTFAVRTWDMIGNMPEDKLEEYVKVVTENKKDYGNMCEPLLFRAIQTGHGVICTYWDGTWDVIEEGFNIMEYLGIGCAYNYKKGSEYIYTYDKRIREVFKKMPTIMRSFKSDIKKGFDIKTAREIAIEDLNAFSESKKNGVWMFYERVDAPTQYPELEPSKKKVKKGE